jgi:hypothetical protein
MPGAQAPQQVFTIEQLVALNPYNPDILPDLESYVDEQVRARGGTQRERERERERERVHTGVAFVLFLSLTSTLASVMRDRSFWDCYCGCGRI